MSDFENVFQNLDHSQAEVLAKDIEDFAAQRRQEIMLETQSENQAWIEENLQEGCDLQMFQLLSRQLARMTERKNAASWEEARERKKILDELETNYFKKGR